MEKVQLIETKCLTLRVLAAQDADWITREIANPRVQCWLTNPPRPYMLADAQSYLAQNQGQPQIRAILVDDTPVGVVGLTGDDPDLGYWLAEHAWGQGYMTEAAAALLGWHFARANTPVQSGWIQGNDASRNVLTKLGFQPNGTELQYSQFHGADVAVDRVRLDEVRYV